MNSPIFVDAYPPKLAPLDRRDPPVVWAWFAIGAFVLLTCVGTFAAAKIMNYVFPTSSFVLSLFLYNRYPIFFSSFSWWLVFLSPLVRRIVDYRSSFTDPSPILLAPILTMIVILPSFIKSLPRAHIHGTVPFAISSIAVVYGFAIGYVNDVPTIKLILGSLGWIYPILYGFFIVMNWRRYPEYRRNFDKTLLWAILVMGLYGIYQYMFLPEWDRQWMIDAEFNVAGNPAPREIRVWSTLNSGEPFSAIMAAGLILILNGRGLLFTGSILAGYITFLLTLVRSGWLGWAGGMFFLFATSKLKFQMRLILSFATLICTALPIIIANSFLEVIQAKINTFSDLENDVSANARRSMYTTALDSTLGNFLGDGISQLNVDSSIFSLVGELGWVGGIPYLLGLCGLIFACWKASKWFTDSSAKLTLAAAVTCLIRIPINSTFVGVSGLMLWGCLAFFVAGAKYAHTQTRSIKCSAEVSL